MDYKFRVDFYYWNCETGFSHVETIENINMFVEAKQYVDNIDMDYFTNIPYNAIWIKIVDNENDYVLSEFWWDLEN